MEEFLLFDANAIANIDITFLRVTLAMLALIHTMAWGLVILLLPFKLLGWVVTSNKK